ncbi:hypothetical protein Rumeso_01605 [Rubellimicrobium mesophilum DSM 19309]|uniref:Uncharacterized protein n=1 Tax=Rubellimicrobium mesophilum DSM 19309 TaxID=442562 RepID=A0A017HQ84_9RHOB|nr:heavy metal-binding domain-containing protein [Rubellimicrobium mesophilum]EYD76647.1 hypothetical protein Rumeso_01605 [Rubellimicrobium mesophilum DSM 19309]
MFRQPTPRREPVLRAVDPVQRQGEPALRREEPALRDVIVTTTPVIEGRPVAAYLGFVAGQSLMEAGLLRRAPKGFRRLFRRGSSTGEDNLAEAREEALQALKAQAGGRGPTRCSACGWTIRCWATG